MMSDLPERLTRAFTDLFASNVFNDWKDYKGGGPGYYGVRIENVAPDGSEIDLILTFLSGKRYCCFQFADHFAHYSERGWSRLRECMDRHGLQDLPLPVLRRVRAVIEKGAVIAPSPKVPMGIWEGSEYQTGPFLPRKKE
jgi:hypothetical protein